VYIELFVCLLEFLDRQVAETGPLSNSPLFASLSAKYQISPTIFHIDEYSLRSGVNGVFWLDIRRLVLNAGLFGIIGLVDCDVHLMSA
jgi:hypothetical protein